MKTLRNILDKVKPHFEDEGKWAKFYPVFQGFEAFLFVPSKTAQSGSHIRDGIDMKRAMMAVIIALFPCLLFGIWNTGHQHYLALGEYINLGDGFLQKFGFGLLKVLPHIIVTYVVGLGIEFIFCIVRKHTINEGFLVTGMAIPMIIPVDTPLWMVAVATAFAVIFGKEIFGGTGMNILNVGLTARAFLFFAYPTKMSGTSVWINTDTEAGQRVIDGFSGATPLGNLASLVNLDKTNPEHADAIAEITGKIPSMMDAFWGFVPGSIGETSVFCCIIGAIFLLITGIGSWRIMISTLVGGYVMATIFNLWGINMFMEVDPLHQLMFGGFMFGALFMSTDPVTATQTDTGKYFYGFFIGFLAIMIRVFNPAYPEGMMLAILFMNVMAPLIDHYVVQANIKHRLHRLKY